MSAMKVMFVDIGHKGAPDLIDALAGEVPLKPGQIIPLTSLAYTALVEATTVMELPDKKEVNI